MDSSSLPPPGFVSSRQSGLGSGSPCENPVFTSHLLEIGESIPFYPKGGGIFGQRFLALACVCKVQ